MSDTEQKRSRPPGPPDAQRRAELEAMFQRTLVQRAEDLDRMRRRAGLSVDQLAKEMGFRGASSIQRYLGSTYEKGFRPELARAFRKAFLGKGNPPITDDDLLFLLKEKMLEPSDPVWNTHQIVRRLMDSRLALQADAASEGRIVARLPLTEGEVIVEMPGFLSAKSAAALKGWLGHLSDYAEESGKLLQEPKHYTGIDPARGKTWEK